MIYIKSNTSEVRAEQVANEGSNGLAEAIYLGADLHKSSIRVTRIIDHSTPQPAQRLDWPKFWRFVEKQLTLAKKVYVVYEAGAFGFWVCRKLQAMGVCCYVVHPEKLDPRCKRVQTDRLDSAHLAERLQRYVLGQRRSMVPVYVPTQEQEQKRLEVRHRKHLSKQLLRLQARGRGLLLSQGVFQTSSWWLKDRWDKLPLLSPTLLQILDQMRHTIDYYQKQLAQSEKQLKAQAPKELPLGFGKLTFVLLLGELCSYQRFKNRRGVGGFTGLCGGVSSSGPYHLDLSINKAGNPELRALLIELTWRMIYYQSNYTGLRVWKRLGSGGSKRQRKIALVAVARQLMVDIWKWQTGQVTAHQLGWQMCSV